MDYVQGLLSSKEGTNYLLTYDQLDVIEWKGNEDKDRKVVHRVKRVLDHDYLATVPSSSSKYFGFVIRELHTVPHMF